MKRCDVRPVALVEIKLMPRSEGNVPSAKRNIVSAPLIKLPEASATSCRDCVNPQGRKNVSAPRVSGARGLLLYESRAIAWLILFGGRSGKLPFGMIVSIVSAK